MITGALVENQIQDLLNDSSLDSKKIPRPTISRVPDCMHRVDDPKAYAPALVSIGPLHHGDTQLASMQIHKVRFFVSLSERLYGSVAIDNELKKAADNMVDNVRQCYSERFDKISDPDFSWMIALDACFVLELFRHYHLHHRHRTDGGAIATTTKGKDGDKDEDDPIFRTWWMVATLRMDLIKIENQLPYFVLQQFYDLTCTSSSSSSSSSAKEPTSLTQYAANFFAPLLPGENGICATDHHLQSSHTHLLAFFHSILNPKKHGNDCVALTSAIISISEGDQSLRVRELKSLPGASELKKYGIVLWLGEGGLLDMLYKNGMLTMTDLAINTDTILLFRNLLAHELCDTRMPSYITSYIAFISQLVSSPKDVTFLRSRRIITHSLLTDEELVTEIKSLSKDVAFVYHDLKNCYLHTLIRQLNMTTRIRRHRWRYILKDKYDIDNPTAILGILGLYIGIIQTIFTILPYVQGRR